MKKTFLWTILFFCISKTLLAAEPAAFLEGNDLYKKGQYEPALEKYIEVIHAGLESCALYFNMGNCYFKKGEWGRSIVNYERAARLAPRDPDIAFNERLAFSKVSAQKSIISTSILQSASRFLFARLTLNEATTCLVLVYLCGLILVAWAAFFSKKPPLGCRWAGAVILLLFLFGIALLYDRINTLNREGIIVGKTVSAKFEPSSDGTTYFELGEGEKITTLEEQKDWTKIRRSDGKAGWIPQNSQETI